MPFLLRVSDYRDLQPPKGWWCLRVAPGEGRRRQFPLLRRAQRV